VHFALKEEMVEASLIEELRRISGLKVKTSEPLAMLRVAFGDQHTQGWLVTQRSRLASFGLQWQHVM